MIIRVEDLKKNSVDIQLTEYHPVIHTPPARSPCLTNEQTRVC